MARKKDEYLRAKTCEHGTPASQREIGTSFNILASVRPLSIAAV